MRILKELNATFAITGREITNSFKHPMFLLFSLLFPIIFMGLIGGMLSQNLGQHLGFDLMRFIFIGQLVNAMYQGALSGMTSLVEDRENDFTQEMFVAPVSRFSIIIGKAFGASLVSLLSLFSLFAIAIVMGISINVTDLGHILLLAPILALSGAALGMFFIGFVQDPKVADVASFMLIFPQLFLSGALIPASQTTGFLGFLVHILPMTYLVDLAHGVFYAGQSVQQQIVLYPAWFDLLVTTGFFAVFMVVGTIMFSRSERNR